MIKIQMNSSDPASFAFTFELPGPPRVGEHVYVGSRKFKVTHACWYPFEVFPLHLLAVEL